MKKTDLESIINRCKENILKGVDCADSVEVCGISLGELLEVD